MSLCVGLVRVSGMTKCNNRRKYSNKIDPEFNVTLLNPDMSMPQWLRESCIYIKEQRKKLEYLDNQSQCR